MPKLVKIFDTAYPISKKATQGFLIYTLSTYFLKESAGQVKIYQFNDVKQCQQGNRKNAT
jgi:hypothetical protein